MIGQYVTMVGDVISHVNITGVVSEDGGEYECKAVSRAGSVHHSARLNIYGPPSIRTMTSISTIAGKTLTIKCPVSGYPIDMVFWEKDGTKLPINMWQHVTNGTLIMENVQRTIDQGTYACTARNKHNFTSQKAVEVKVLGKYLPISFSFFS